MDFEKQDASIANPPLSQYAARAKREEQRTERRGLWLSSLPLARAILNFPPKTPLDQPRAFARFFGEFYENREL